MAFTPVPVFIPSAPVQIPCIIQDGVRYCESQPITASDAGYIGLFFCGVILWALAIGYFLVEEDRPGIAIAIVFAPFVLLAVWGFW